MAVRKELFVCLGSALFTAAGLFTLQLWYASYLDVAVVHGDRSGVDLDAKLEALRNEEHGKLNAGRMPIHQAMQALAQRGRSAFPELAAQPSNDLSAMSGWIKKPGFKPYVPRTAAARAEATPLAGGAAASRGAEDSAPQEQRHAR
jgi:hypothetical protein